MQDGVGALQLVLFRFQIVGVLAQDVSDALIHLVWGDPGRAGIVRFRGRHYHHSSTACSAISLRGWM